MSNPPAISKALNKISSTPPWDTLSVKRARPKPQSVIDRPKIIMNVINFLILSPPYCFLF
ncbi:MAG TPA: hypothetical protein EYH35_02660 [Thiotrichaceae bacterium]|nr:hypothetical protein [Thiotrichaceae bacterium]